MLQKAVVSSQPYFLVTDAEAHKLADETHLSYDQIKAGQISLYGKPVRIKG